MLPNTQITVSVNISLLIFCQSVVDLLVTTLTSKVSVKTLKFDSCIERVFITSVEVRRPTRDNPKMFFASEKTC